MQHNNLWAPWRIEYLRDLENSERDKDRPEPDCFICAYLKDAPAKDRENLVLWRRPGMVVLMNRFPYTGGHLLIAPDKHVAELSDLNEPSLLSFMTLSRDCQTILGEVLRPHGFNVGINFGRCSGAGLPGHVHLHIVPRWNGDTNFMSVSGNSRVISQSLDELYDELMAAGLALNLP